MLRAGLIVLVLTLVSLPAMAAGQEGELDTAFTADGIVTTALGAGAEQANAVKVQPDQKIVAAGYSNNGANNLFAATRYNPSGSLDTTFSGDGKVRTAIGSASSSAAAVALQFDGKIVLAGTVENGSTEDFALVRYNTNGSLDTTFSGDGKLATAIGSGDDNITAVAMQRDGKIVVAGYAYVAPNNRFALARYNPNGSLDTTFSGDGKLTTAIGSSAEANALVIQSDGKVVAAGISNNGSDYDFALARYNSNGALDPTFDTDGKLTTAIGSGDDYGFAAVLQADGRVVVAGSSSDGSQFDLALARYNPNGSLDTTLGIDGKATQGIGVYGAVIYALALQPNGQLVAAGSSSNGSSNRFALVRFDADGSLDTDLEPNGLVVTPVGSASDAYAIAIQRDGKIVAAGRSYNGANNDFALARFIGDATAPYGARMIGVPRYSSALTRTLVWAASDDNTGIAAYDVRVRRAAYNAGTYGAWSTLKSQSINPYGAATFSPGYTYCLADRGRDYAGNVGSYSSPSCVAFPVDDRTSSVHGSWTSGAGSSYYKSTYRSSTTAGASLTLPVVFRRVALLVTTCSSCGKVRVYLGSTLLNTINTYASSTHHKVLIAVTSSTTTRTGTLKLVQDSAGKKLIIDGVAVNLEW
jgi:uncharacterized delta-60 repeat protein